MSLLQKLFDADFWKQRVKALSRDLNTTYDKLCEVTEKWRSAEKEVSDLKAEVQLAENDFDEMASLYAALHKAFDDLVDTNADLAKKLREATLHKTANEKLQRDVIDLQQYNAAVTAEVKKLQVASAEWDSMYKGYVTATNENSRLKAENESLTKNLVEVTKHCNQLETAIENQNATIAKRAEQLRVSNNEIIALKEQCRAATVECNKRDTEYKTLSEQYDKLHKVNETLTTKLGKLELENNKLEIKLSDNDFNSAYTQSELHTRNLNLIIQLESTKKDRDTYKDLATHNHKSNLRLIDKVKAIQEIVKVLEPVSMRFQTALFDLLDDTNVPRV